MGVWNIDLLRQHFLEEEAQTIKNIVVGGRGCKTSWHGSMIKEAISL